MSEVPQKLAELESDKGDYKPPLRSQVKFIAIFAFFVVFCGLKG